MQNGTTEQILEQIHNPSPDAQKVRETWEGKTPTETVAVGRKLLYGAVTPALAESDLSVDAIQEIEAMFEATFSKLEEYGRTRSGTRSQS